MSAETDLRAALVAYAPLVALVGQRVVENAIPEGSGLPYVVFTSQHAPVKGLDGTVLVDEVSFAVECWAAGAIEADAVANAVQAAILAAGSDAEVVTRSSGFDGDLGLDATVLAVQWWA